MTSKRNVPNEPTTTTNNHEAPETLETDSFIKEITKNLPPPKDRSIFWDIVCSIFEPGVNSGLMFAVHFSFLSLAAVNFWLIYLNDGREWFIWGLTVLNFILYFCLLVFVHLAYAQPEVKSN